MIVSAALLFAALSAAPRAEEVPPAVKAALTELLGEVDKMEVAASPIGGVFEVVVDSYIFYVSQDGRYIIRGGDILDIKDNIKNLTEERRNGLRLKDLGQVKRDEMIVFAPKEGKTKHVLTVFTDVDCFYCAKLHQEVPKLNEAGVEVHYLAFPRSGPGSPTHQKMVSVWCAKDRNQALTDAKSGKDVPPAQCENPVAQQFEVGRRLGVSGTPALVLPNGELLPGYAPAEKLLKYLEGL
jgi:thiol:disulfide interchange protein DsbC